MIFTKENLVDMLRNNIVTVTFTKVNGDERVMRCTLRSEMIPNAPTQNGELVVEQKQSSNNVSVWDVDSQGWRSFRVASVRSISVG
jgi:hypothetical protein